MASRKIQEFYRALKDPSVTNKVEIMSYLLREYDEHGFAQSEDKNLIMKIFADREIYKGLSPQDVKRINDVANRESGFWDVLGGSLGGKGFSDIQENIRRYGEEAAYKYKEKDKYSQEKMAKDSIDAYRKNIDEIDRLKSDTEDRRDEIYDIYEDKSDLYKDLASEFEDELGVLKKREGQAEDIRGDRHRRANEQFNMIRQQIEKRRGLSHQILERAKRFGMSPSIAQAEFKKLMADQARQRVEQSVMRRGTGFSDTKGRGDIARELGEKDMFVKKLIEDQSKQRYVDSAHEKFLGREGQMDRELSSAKQIQGREKTDADRSKLDILRSLDVDRRMLKDLIFKAKMGDQNAKQRLIQLQQGLDDRQMELSQKQSYLKDRMLKMGGELKNIEKMNYNEINSLYDELSEFEAREKNMARGLWEAGKGLGKVVAGGLSGQPSILASGASDMLEGGSGMLNYKQTTKYSGQDKGDQELMGMFDNWLSGNLKGGSSGELSSILGSDILNDQLINSGFSLGKSLIG